MKSLLNKNPIISICIPVYNGEKYLSETLTAIANQTYENIEIIIVDDNSTDNSKDIIQDFTHSIFRLIKIRNHDNLGLLSNWKKCVDLANGDWIKFVFQDDVLEKDCVKEMILTAQRTGKHLICGHKTYFFSEEIKVRTIISYKYIEYTNKAFTNNKENIEPLHFYDFFIRNLSRNFLGEPSCFLINKKLIERYGDFNKNLIQLLDYELYARISANEGLAYSKNAHIKFRVHNNSETFRNRGLKQLRSSRLDQIIFLYTILNNKNYINFLSHSREALHFNYIEALLANHLKKAHSIISKSKEAEITSQWNETASACPNITDYLSNFHIKDIMIITFCKTYINVRHALHNASILRKAIQSIW